jgi:hypothetical protein
MEDDMADTMARIEPDLARMERWTAWVARLMGDAAVVAPTPADRAELAGAAEDAESLRRRLRRAGEGWLDERETTQLLMIYDLWDANHDRFEQLAELCDPEGFRSWWNRSVGARPPRYGGTFQAPGPDDLARAV